MALSGEKGRRLSICEIVRLVKMFLCFDKGLRIPEAARPMAVRAVLGRSKFRSVASDNQDLVGFFRIHHTEEFWMTMHLLQQAGHDVDDDVWPEHYPHAAIEGVELPTMD